MQSESPTEPIRLSDDNNDRRYLQLILGAVPVGVVVVDEGLAIQAFNTAAERITGVTAAEAIGQPYAQVMKTHERDIADPLEEALAERKMFVNQRFFLRGEALDDRFPIRHSASVLTDEEGEVIGGVTIFADISRQVALERQLASQRRYLRDVLSSIPDGVVTTDSELLIDSWNESAVEITGRYPSQAIGQPCSEVLGPAVATVLESLLQQDGGIISGQQAQLSLEDETALPIGFSAGSIQTPGEEETIGGIVVFRDISERLNRQRDLAQQRRYLDQVLGLAPYGIFTVDLNLAIQTFNQAAEELTGIADSFAIGKPYHQVVKLDPDSGTDPLPFLLTARGEPKSVRLRLVDAEGARVPIRYAVAPLTDIDDELTGAIVIFQDISDIVAAERTKNEFISMVSHELRTPLTSIKGFVTAVLDGRAGEVNDRQKRFLSISREQSNLLLSLINDLLDLTQLESGEVDLNQNQFAVDDLVSEAAEAIEPMARRKNLSVGVDISPDLPSLWADRDKLFQVLQNLLSNAVKFTPMEGEITIAAHLDDEETVCLSVTDSGIGISPEEQRQIFEPFYQVESIQTRKVGGTGLGLAIVQRITEAHGGRVELESEVGVGSTFRVCIPLARAAGPTTSLTVRERPVPSEPQPSEPEEAGPVEKPLPPRPARLNPLVLVIEDDEATNSLIQFLLEEEGYDVISATNGQDALQMATEEQPDLITLDILMPEMDGFHVLELLNKRPVTSSIPVCIVSIIEDKVKGYRLGAIDYITKPFESEQLTAAVQSVLKPHGKSSDTSILVVEDDPNIVELVELALEKKDYHIITASNGVSALEKLRHDRPHLVLLDIMLPKLDGYEFIRQAKADPRTEEIPILVLSVRSLEADINRALRLGAEKYLVKPPTDGVDDLTQVVGETIQEMLQDDNE
jgi:PAS domain S-box-containing protein